MLKAQRTLGRVLVVEDHAPLRKAIAALLANSGAEVLEAETEREAIARLDPPPDLIICDVYLPDGSAQKIFEATLQLSPEPVKIAMSGCASAEEAFQLAKLGVLAYLPKPFALEQLSESIERVLCAPPDIDTLLRASVGRVPMRQLQQRVRSVMVGQALALTSGSRSGAARLLDVSRQAVQQITRARNKVAAKGSNEQAARVDPPPA